MSPFLGSYIFKDHTVSPQAKIYSSLLTYTSYSQRGASTENVLTLNQHRSTQIFPVSFLDPQLVNFQAEPKLSGKLPHLPRDGR